MQFWHRVLYDMIGMFDNEKHVIHEFQQSTELPGFKQMKFLTKFK